MNRKMTFFTGMLSCLVVSNFFAAESKKIELTTIKKPEFIPLTEGLQTLIPKILVTLKTEGSIPAYSEKKIDTIYPSDKQWTLEGLMNRNYCWFINTKLGTDSANKLFLPTLIRVNADTSIVKLRTFSSMISCPKFTEACRQEKAVFYSYKQGAIISFWKAKKIDIRLLERNEDTLKKMIDEEAQKKLELLFPVISCVS